MGKKRVLIIDDEAAFTQMVKLNLEGTGKYEVQIENKGAHAIETIKKFVPDLILLDIVMPDKAGSDLASELKADNSIKDIPVIFLTALVTQKETEGTCGVISGYPFIAKPVKLKELIACIDKYAVRNYD